MRHILKTVAVTLALVWGCFNAGADEISDKGRDIFQKNNKAVVTIQVVQKVSGGRSGSAKESKQDLTGTVIDPSGLTVIALSSADPADLYRRLSEEYKVEIEITEVRILQEDGTETPAEIVLRDKDLDLAFIRPKLKPTNAIPAIDLTKSSAAQVLDEVIFLNRLKRAAGRSYSASVDRVGAVLRKPRTFYVPASASAENAMGSPVFALNGKLLGVMVMRAVNAQGVGNWRDCVTAIILPAEDILKSSAQAPEAKPPTADDEKKDSPKDAPAKTNTATTNAPAQ